MVVGGALPQKTCKIRPPMPQPPYTLRFWGVRGTVPTPSPHMLRYGGNTSCIGVSLGPHEQIILDCGSGLRLLGNDLAAAKSGGPGGSFHVLLSHYHLDHIEGIPFFHPLYDPASRFTFHGFEAEGRSVREILQTLISPPYCPVSLAGVPSTVRYVTVDGTPLVFGDVEVRSLPLNHPNGSLCYRLTREGRHIVFATDHEHGEPETDEALIRFSRDAEVLIYDATYLRAEYEELRRGWGHSTWYAAVQLAKAAGVKRLILFHHHPDHTDDDLDAVLRVAREELPATEIAREGMEIPL
jgi:phosphoribosyl 1,2-cyclic phosphodiesterase